ERPPGPTHLVVLRRYLREFHRFLLRNSWGDQWGHEGWAMLPYEYFDAHVFESWVTYPVTTPHGLSQRRFKDRREIFGQPTTSPAILFTHFRFSTRCATTAGSLGLSSWSVTALSRLKTCTCGRNSGDGGTGGDWPNRSVRQPATGDYRFACRCRLWTAARRIQPTNPRLLPLPDTLGCNSTRVRCGGRRTSRR